MNEQDCVKLMNYQCSANREQLILNVDFSKESYLLRMSAGVLNDSDISESVSLIIQQSLELLLLCLGQNLLS